MSRIYLKQHRRNVMQIIEHMGRAFNSMCSALHLTIKVDLHTIRAD